MAVPAAAPGDFACIKCGSSVPPSKRDCVVCGADNGCPNVRQAESASERGALAARLADAEVSARARASIDILNTFGMAVLNSSAVVARPLSLLDSMVKSEKSLYIPYHRQVASGARLPENNEWDPGRVAAESTIMPHYFDQITFAALSLNGIGPTSFGAYSIILKDNAIALRASVFEENPFLFTVRHRILAGQPCPPGYRASWQHRDILAKAKLHALINSGTIPSQFAGILIANKTAGDSDYVEVHIFGNIHRLAIERVIGPKPKARPDRIIMKSIEKSLIEVGASLELR